ncbi:MAG: cation transporter [Lachnospiraceae bacterium]|nr:cation transporter [Lachnospiraceae bacterium]
MNQIVSNTVIIVILVVAFMFALKSSVAHFRGEGSCCGGGGKDVKTKPKKLSNVISVKEMKIDGMHCDHCYTRVHNALNSIDGVNAKVYGKRKKAVIKIGKQIDDSNLTEAVNALGYTVVSIKDI